MGSVILLSVRCLHERGHSTCTYSETSSLPSAHLQPCCPPCRCALVGCPTDLILLRRAEPRLVPGGRLAERVLAQEYVAGRWPSPPLHLHVLSLSLSLSYLLSRSVPLLSLFCPSARCVSLLRPCLSPPPCMHVSLSLWISLFGSLSLPRSSLARALPLSCPHAYLVLPMHAWYSPCMLGTPLCSLCFLFHPRGRRPCPRIRLGFPGAAHPASGFKRSVRCHRHRGMRWRELTSAPNPMYCTSPTPP